MRKERLSSEIRLLLYPFIKMIF